MNCKSKRRLLSFFLSSGNKLPASSDKAFTLLELIVVIIIVGVLATLGFTQYTLVVEKGRFAEAKGRIGTMRQLTYDYYWKNGSLTGITNSDVGVTNSCGSTSYFRYFVGLADANVVRLCAKRCTSGGKSPDAANVYTFYMYWYPSTGQIEWYKNATDPLNPCTDCGVVDTASYCPS